MALTGELSDLSLAELIEFFCNQRKTGRLKVIYPIGPGYFYLQAGSVVHARIGILRGIEAVYCALTLPNASFTFSPAFEAPEHSINQPWTSVVLEGLRRMDEGVIPRDPFSEETKSPIDEVEAVEHEVEAKNPDSVPFQDEEPAEVFADDVAQPVAEAARPVVELGAFLSQTQASSRFANGPWRLGAVMASVALVVAVIAVPWGWYARSKAAKLTNETKPLAVENTLSPAPTITVSEPAPIATANQTSEVAPTSDAAELAAKRQREARAKERAKAQETAATLPPSQSSPVAATPSVAKAQSSPTTAARKVTVQVTYDENGRVTQASGGDPTALRIARQKRFPAGKAGSATVTIPIN